MIPCHAAGKLKSATDYATGEVSHRKRKQSNSAILLQAYRSAFTTTNRDDWVLGPTRHVFDHATKHIAGTQSESKKLRRVFLTFPKRLKTLKWNFTRLLYVYIYAKLVVNFIRLPPTQICSHDFWLHINLYVCMLYICMTKLCHINGTTLISW